MTGCNSTDRHKPTILLIVVDTLRTDHVGLYGYNRPTTPGLDSYFKDAAIFKRAYATSANTPPSMVSLLSGLLPQDHSIRLFYQKISPTLKMIPGLLPEEYETAGFVSNNVLTDEALGWAKRFDYFNDYVTQKEPYRNRYERSAEKTTDAVLEWFRNREKVDRPLFLMVHYIDPHGPYQPPEFWNNQFSHKEKIELEVDRINPYMRLKGVTDAQTYVDRYDEEILFSDIQIDRLLKAFHKIYPEEETFVIFTADHGESLIDHELWFTHEYHTYEELIHIPLMIRGEGIKPGRIDKIVSQVDIFETILSVTGSDYPNYPYNENLLEWPSIDENRTVYAEGGNQLDQIRAAIGSDTKWMVTIPRGKSEITRKWSYDLKNDAKELAPKPWNGENDTIVKQFINLCLSDKDPGGFPKKIINGTELEFPKYAPNISKESIEKLRSLGYVN